MNLYAQIPTLDDISDEAALKNHSETCKLLRKYHLETTPMNYLVAYEHIRGEHKPLSAAVIKQQQTAAGLDRIVFRNLFDQFFVSPPNDQSQDMFHHADAMMTKTIGRLAQAETGLNEFDIVLGRQKSVLESSKAADDISRAANILVQATEKANQSNKDLQSELISVQREAETLKAELERVKQESHTDSLTGLLNRNALDELTASLDENRTEDENRDYSILMIDIDHFKKINDAYGHLLGDQVIKRVAQTIKNGVRGNDLVARYGGEEFLVLLPGTPGIGAEVVAKTVCVSVEKLCLVEKESENKIPTITISIGISTHRENEKCEQVIERADRALYFSKQNGRNRYTTEKILESATEAETLAVSA